jgi:hypothetical protein
VLAVILFIWLCTLTISVPPFFGFGAFVPETSGVDFMNLHFGQTKFGQKSSNKHFSDKKIRAIKFGQKIL